jgi:hypothetical protein
MPPRRLYLKPGTDPDAALGVLKHAIAEPDSFGFANDDVTFRNRYLEWTENVEAHLQHLTNDPEVVEMLQTPRHWHIRASDTTSLSRLHALISAEIAVQKTALDQLRADLSERMQRATAAPGQICVVDTNVLLEYVAPADILWHEVVGAEQVRLVVPLRVVEELDAAKYARRSDLADRARRALSSLQGMISRGGAPGELREGVTIEVPVDSGPRSRPDDPDREILNDCDELRQLSGESVVLLTADMAMRLRGEAERIDVAPLPDKYARQRGSAG